MLSVVIRAVAGLLHHIHTLKPKTLDWDKKFEAGLGLCTTLRDKTTLGQHEVRLYC